MAKEKACKKCKAIYEGNKCPNCQSDEHTDAFKGRVMILNPENSEIASNLKLKGKGKFAIKLG